LRGNSLSPSGERVRERGTLLSPLNIAKGLRRLPLSPALSPEGEREKR
jgi:hypothetical protein